MRRLSFVLLLAVLVGPLRAQGNERITTLTLDEAIGLATRNNPQYLEAINSRRQTALRVRTAYGALFPRLTSSLGFSWREGLPTVFEGQQFGAAADQLGSNYNLGISVGYDYASFLNPKLATSQLDGAEATVTNTQQGSKLNVTTQYFNAVEAVRNAALQDSLVRTQKVQYDFASAKERIGSGISLETAQALVRLRRQELTAIRAHNTAELQKVRLFETIGVPAPGPDVQLTTDLPVVEPKFLLADLIADAKAHNASLAGARAQERTAQISSRQVKGRSYIPAFSIGTGIGGYTNMATDATGTQRTWPFSFTRNAIGVNANFSLTLWDGFNREQNIESSNLQLNNAQHEVRRTELNVVTNVTSFHSELVLAWRTVQLQIQIVDGAQQALLLAQNRYQIGSTDYTALSIALDSFQLEQNTLLVDTYNYHRTFAQLEFYVGHALR